MPTPAQAGIRVQAPKRDKSSKSPYSRGRAQKSRNLKNNHNIMTDDMIIALRQKLSPNALEQAVWLETHRTCQLLEATDEELNNLYHRFCHTPNYKAIAEDLLNESEVKRLRSIILADAQVMGILKQNNWVYFNKFMKERSPLKKFLRDYTLDELPELVRQFKSMRTKFEKASVKVGSKQWYTLFGIAEPSMN